MNYTHIRFAYYDTFTEAQYKPARLTEFEAKNGPQGSRAEAIFRAAQFVAAARYVADQIKKDPDSGKAGGQVLTIFLAPEFYMRSSVGLKNGRGHYQPEEVNTAHLRIRLEMANEDRFDNWLFVPGTAVQQIFLNPFRVILSNAFCVARQGKDTTPWYCIKQTFSPVDELDKSLNVHLFDPSYLARSTQINRVNGVNVGLEICLDHDHAALKRKVLAGNPPSGVDVQLVVACGSSVREESIAAREGGYVLRCNGNDLDPPGAREFKVHRWSEGHPSDGIPQAEELFVPHTSFVLPKQLQIVPNRRSDTVGYFGPLKL